MCCGDYLTRTNDDNEAAAAPFFETVIGLRSVPGMSRPMDQRREEFPRTENDKDDRENSPHRGLRNADGNAAAEDASEENAGNNQESCADVNRAGVVIGEKSQQAGGRHEGDKARALRTVLLEMVNNDEQWNKQGPATDAE
jgi:hypothetical protein